jgi:ABC-type cobalamin/Fe3+-siderophores transport system ATPase subunit
VAYCAHDTLIEEGSTGQKQLANINQTLTQKASAQIFLFDEANNALDSTNQANFQDKVKTLGKEKIVVYIKGIRDI